ncbi:hypothetical protein [Polaribacter sp. Hel_I_88]|uniref:hypothetical protein n=1 Tax=Polaribacter sp. Hel_I_88 TaxID=1250006 RepID=UPI0004794D59|nr:hypothetical protein [Polaribacter sp. Hel_I_88]
MKISLKNKKTDTSLFTVPEFNYGQMQRWAGEEQLKYSLEITIETFITKFSNQFSSFRKDEIIEDDCLDLEVLIAYKNAGRPTLKQLFSSNLSLLANLIIYHQYEILHAIIGTSLVGKLFYSINSIDKVEFTENKIYVEGICFKVDRQ